jgi:hypothetical protein
MTKMFESVKTKINFYAYICGRTIIVHKETVGK